MDKSIITALGSLLCCVVLINSTCFAGIESFDPNSKWELESQYYGKANSEENISKLRWNVTSQLSFIQNSLEPLLQAGVTKGLDMTMTMGLYYRFWMSNITQNVTFVELGFGQPLNVYGLGGLRLLMFHENLENGNQEDKFDPAISFAYIKEIKLWRDLEIHPRFELEAGYRNQPFLRKGLFIYKVSYTWASASLGISF